MITVDEEFVCLLYEKGEGKCCEGRLTAWKLEKLSADIHLSPFRFLFVVLEIYTIYDGVHSFWIYLRKLSLPCVEAHKLVALS